MYEPTLKPWYARQANLPIHLPIQEDFPVGGAPADKLRFCLCYAVLAPSLQNSQPWRFKIEGDHVALFADLTRQVPYVDPDHRQLIISCGAALFNLRVALHAFGYAGEIAELPDPADQNRLATVGLGTPHAPTVSDRTLFESIPKRHTNRLPFSDRQISDESVHTMQVVAGEESVWLQEVREGPTRTALADLIGEGDEEELADPRYRREVAAWLQPRGERRADGIPHESSGMPGLISWVGPYRVRTFDTGAFYTARERQLVINSPLLTVLGTQTDTRRDWLRSGQALAHILLLATSWDACASFLNSPIEVQNLRPRVAEVIGRSGYPQLILRLGYAEERASAPRRTIEAVVEESP